MIPTLEQADLAVQFEDDVDVTLDCLARGCDTLCHPAHQRVLRHVAVSARDGIEFDGGETFLSCRHRVRVQFLWRRAAHKEVQSDPVAVLAAQQLPDWRLKGLTLDH